VTRILAVCIRFWAAGAYGAENVYTVGMGISDSFKQTAEAAKQFAPRNLKRLANVRIATLIEKEAARARHKIDGLHEKYPSAQARELAQRLIDDKKQLASMIGGISGVFGVATLPLDLLGMVYLQISLLAEIATLFKVSLKPEREKNELLDLFGEANGIGPVKRASPKLLGSLAAMLLAKGGLKTLGRAMPLVAAPISAYLNNKHIQKIGEEAVRFYDGWHKAHEKSQKASGM
jgi:hypothetical protein